MRPFISEKLATSEVDELVSLSNAPDFSNIGNRMHHG
jgi:hypothetical protein